MDLRISHLDFSAPPLPVKPKPAEGAASADHSLLGCIPAEPPEDALREVDRAATRAEKLWRAQRELHFELDEYSGRVIVQVRDLDGRVIRTIPPSEALDVLSCGPL
jgi:hypothetical protein